MAEFSRPQNQISPVAEPLRTLFESHANYLSPFHSVRDLEQRAATSFSPDYSAARAKFIDAAIIAGARMEEYQLAASARNGSPLFVDFAIFESGTPERVLLHLSGTHGPEGYSGSAIQHDLLRNCVDVPDNTMIVFCHALNPFGMAEFQRTNEDNIDPNRNYRSSAAEFGQGLCPDYSGIDWLVHPDSEATLEILLQTMNADERARESFLDSMAHFFPGQNDKPGGLFYSGNKLIQSFNFLNHLIENQIPATVQDVFIVDVHTGLGDFGDEMLFSNRKAPLADGSDLYTKLTALNGIAITAPDPDADNFYEAKGDTVQGAAEFLEQRGINCNGICQEFGTYSFKALVATLIAENYYRTQGQNRPEHALAAIKEVFNPASREWQKSILYRGQQLFEGLVETFLRDF